MTGVHKPDPWHYQYLKHVLIGDRLKTNIIWKHTHQSKPIAPDFKVQWFLESQISLQLQALKKKPLSFHVFYVQLEVKQFISHKTKICKQLTIQQDAKIIKLPIPSKEDEFTDYTRNP